MPKFIVNLHAQYSHEYEIEADDADEAIAKAKDINSSQSLEEMNQHMYDFDWLDCDAYTVKDETFDLKGSIFDKVK